MISRATPAELFVAARSDKPWIPPIGLFGQLGMGC